jgi:uncharacterized protein with HEPN domain
MSTDRLPVYLVYLAEMRRAACNACRFVEGMSKTEFFEDERTQQAVAMSLIIIGEDANKILEKHAGFDIDHPQMPWSKMRGMRNRIVHAYFSIDWQFVWDTVHKDLPRLVETIDACVNAGTVANGDDDDHSPGY